MILPLISSAYADPFERDAEALTVADNQAEKRLLRKIDLYILPTASLLYLFCFIDRANVGTYPTLDSLTQHTRC